MNARIRTLLSLIDVIGIPVFIGWFIWRGQFSAPLSWLGFPCWLTSSFLIHRDTPKSLGMRADNLWPATQQAAVVFGVFVIALVLTGLALGRPCVPRRITAHSAGYGRLRLLPGATDCAELAVDEPAGIACHAPLAGERYCGSNFQRSALAESCAGTFDIDWGHSHGLDVRARAKHFAAGGGTSHFGVTCMVGVSNRMAPHVAGRTGLLLSILKGILVPSLHSRSE